MARRILRDMKDASAYEIRAEAENYFKYARIAYLQMPEKVKPSSDYVLDGTKSIAEPATKISDIIQ